MKLDFSAITLAAATRNALWFLRIAGRPELLTPAKPANWLAVDADAEPQASTAWRAQTLVGWSASSEEKAATPRGVMASAAVVDTAPEVDRIDREERMLTAAASAGGWDAWRRPSGSPDGELN